MARVPIRPVTDAAPSSELFVEEANRIANDLTRHAVRRGPAAAWIGLDWLGDSEVAQLASLRPDLYNGQAGISVFLAAHAAVTGNSSSKELAMAGVAHLRAILRGRNAARTARLLGIGGAIGMGSIVYAFSVMAKCLQDNDLVSDACLAASLFTDDLISADSQLDIVGGSAGGILGLLRLFRHTNSSDVLVRATKCGDHLLAQPRHGAPGYRSWIGLGAGSKPLNGMSHGAAGYAHALVSLAAATGREDFAVAATECLNFENSNYDLKRANWSDLRIDQESKFPCEWCHGAVGIGLSRIAMNKRSVSYIRADQIISSVCLEKDIANALVCAERNWPADVDTMCCGTLGSIEFFREAGDMFKRNEFCRTAAGRLMAVLMAAAENNDYRWNTGSRQSNLGLFRGLAGVGYTCLRQADRTLPNILTWE